MPVVPGLALPADWRARGANRAQVPGGGEAGHVDPDLGDELLGAGPADAGNLIEPIQLPGLYRVDDLRNAIAEAARGHSSAGTTIAQR